MWFFIFKVDIVNIKEGWKGFFCLREIVIYFFFVRIVVCKLFLWLFVFV